MGDNDSKLIKLDKTEEEEFKEIAESLAVDKKIEEEEFKTIQPYGDRLFCRFLKDIEQEEQWQPVRGGSILMDVNSEKINNKLSVAKVISAGIAYNVFQAKRIDHSRDFPEGTLIVFERVSWTPITKTYGYVPLQSVHSKISSLKEVAIIRRHAIRWDD